MIHPTALIDPQARLASDIRIGPYVVVDGPVTVGPGCVIHPFARLIGPLTLGARNVLHSRVVLGDWPQDRKYTGQPSETIIGDDNIFREGVTVHRGTGAGTKTVLGSRCFLMVNAHVGHNSVVGNDVTMINGSLLGGHVHVADRAIIGANCAMHQFTRVGRLAMVSNCTAHSVDMPPFVIAMQTNFFVQLNNVGLRRSGMPRENITALRQLLRLMRSNRHLPREFFKALPADLLAVPEVQEFVTFCLTTKRGVARFSAWSSRVGGDAPDTD